MILLPARRVTVLFVSDHTSPSIVNLSVVTPVPVAPASSHTSLSADIPPVEPLPPIVNGLVAIIVTLPPVVLPGSPLVIQPDVDSAPVLRMLISPVVPVLLAVNVLTWVFNGVPPVPKPEPIPVKAVKDRLGEVMRPEPVMAPDEALKVTDPNIAEIGVTILISPVAALRVTLPLLEVTPVVPLTVPTVNVPDGGVG